MPLSIHETEKVAMLARLRLPPEELVEMSQQLARVLDYVDQLQQVETRGVEPLAHTAELLNVFADDVVAPSLNREAALGNAPKRDEECFLVPAVMGDGS